MVTVYYRNLAPSGHYSVYLATLKIGLNDIMDVNVIMHSIFKPIIWASVVKPSTSRLEIVRPMFRNPN